LALDKGNPSCAKTLMLMNEIDLHYSEGAIMIIALYKGYIYLCELLMLKDATLSKYLKNNKNLFKYVLKYGTYNEILKIYTKFGYNDGELIDILKKNASKINVDSYKHFSEHFNFDVSLNVNFGKSQVLDLSKFGNDKEDAFKKQKQKPRSVFDFTSSTSFKSFTNEESLAKTIDNSKEFINRTGHIIKRPNNKKNNRPNPSRGLF